MSENKSEYILNLMDELIYVADIETYELLYVNEALKEAFNVNEYKGKKCYEVLQGKDAPCAFCTNSFINKDDFYAWEIYNEVARKRFLLKDKLIDWEGKTVRLEMASDITEKESLSKAAQEKIGLKDFLDNTFKRLSDALNDREKNKLAINYALKNAAMIYEAERAYIFEFGYKYNLIDNTYEWCAEGVEPQIDFLKNLDYADFAHWNRACETDNKILIKRLEDIRDSDPNMYSILKVQDINNLIVVPIRRAGSLIGYLGVDNPKKQIDNEVPLILLAGALSSNPIISEEFNVKSGKNDALLSKEKDLDKNDFKTIIESIADFIISIDSHTETYAILQYGSIGEYLPETGLYDDFLHYCRDEIIYEDDSAIWLNTVSLKNLKSSSEGRSISISNKFRIKRASGDNRFAWHYSVIIPSDDDLDRYIMVSVNINMLTLRNQFSMQRAIRQRETELRKIHNQTEARYRIIVEEMMDGIFEWAADAEALPNKLSNGEGSYFVSDRFVEKFGFTGEDTDFLAFFMLKSKIHPSDVKLYHTFLFKDLNKKYKEVVCRLTTDGLNYKYYKIAKVTSFSADGAQERYVAIISDVSSENQLFKALQYRAERDLLTGLLNQEEFFNQGEEMLKAKNRFKYVVITMDIDKFKVINNIYGLNGGNQALMSIGNKLNEIIGSQGICARLYADVYCALIKYSERQEIFDFMERMTTSLADMENGSMLTPSFGICEVTDRTIPMSQLCEMSGFAHKSAKAINGAHWHFYDDAIRIKTIEEKQLESEMESALAKRQFLVYLQPKYNITTEKVVGAEALVRWKRPESGLVPPNKFIPLFERNGFIIKLDAFVWEESCRLLREWMDKGYNPPPISINVSRLHLHSHNFKETIFSLLEKYDIKPEYIQLELTESLFADSGSISSVLAEFREKGFNINMDDFGSGYSSLNMLKDIEIDTLKIDCGFFREVTATHKGKSIIKHTVAMANDLNINIVAEGVETEQQVEFLKTIECHVIQGYFFAKPMPTDEFEENYLKKQ